MLQFRRLALGFTLLSTSFACAAQLPTATPQSVPPTVPATPPIVKPAAAPSLIKPAPTSPTTTPAAIPPTAVTHSLDSADLNAFFDGIIPLQLERSDIAGASVLVMKDGQVLLQKGYGYADIKQKKAVDPNTSIFRLASISKLFTWVSVMQLVEQGKLNLDTDVNQYLDFQIRPAPHSVSDKPVTLRNLMTHTGGFEESILNILLTDPKKAISLRDNLIQNQPNRIYPPGEVPAYSNYGVGLASYIVQRTSGEPFEQYVQEHIFNPLGMAHSSFYQPLPKSLEKLPSEGYHGNTTKPVVGFEIFNPVGAGGLSSTAPDMGRFGSMLLNGGSLDGHQILKAETLAQMWTPQYQANPQMPPICMGFYQDWRNNLRWIGHEGDLIAFHSLFFVEPTQKIVLFISYNSAGGGAEPRPELIDFFSDRYFPGAPAFTPMKTTPDDMKQIAGTYQTTRRADSTRLAVSNLFGQRNLGFDKDGNLVSSAIKDLRGHPLKWKPVGKDLWQAEGEQSKMFAIRDGSGHIVRIAVSFPGVQVQRVAWYENGKWLIPAFSISLAILAAVLLATILRTGRRIFLRKRVKLAPQPGTVWLSWGPRLAAITWIVLLSGVGGFFMSKGDEFLPPNPDWFIWLNLLNGAVGLCLLFSLFAVISGIRVWRRDLRWITKVKFTLVAVACVVVSYWAVHWHLIGPTTRI